MEKLAKIMDDKLYVFEGTDEVWAKAQGFTSMNLEKAFNGQWYFAGEAPQYSDDRNYQEKRIAEYPALGEQLDLIYWDKVNGTNNWENKISEIKAKYPKDETTTDIDNSLFNV